MFDEVDIDEVTKAALNTNRKPLFTSDFFPGYRAHEVTEGQTTEAYVQNIDTWVDHALSDGVKDRYEDYTITRTEGERFNNEEIDVVFVRVTESNGFKAWVGVSRDKNRFNTIYQVAVMHAPKDPARAYDQEESKSERLSMYDFDPKQDYLLRISKGTGVQSDKWLTSGIGNQEEKELVNSIFEERAIPVSSATAQQTVETEAEVPLALD